MEQSILLMMFLPFLQKYQIIGENPFPGMGKLQSGDAGNDRSDAEKEEKAAAEARFRIPCHPEVQPEGGSAAGQAENPSRQSVRGDSAVVFFSEKWSCMRVVSY